MYKSISFIFILGAVLISAQSTEETDEASESSVTTETNKYGDILTDIDTSVNQTLVTEPTKYGYQPNDTSTFVPSTEVEKVTEIVTTSTTTSPPTTELPKFNQTEAEIDIKEYSEKLDCTTSPVGEFKCLMFKKLTKKYFESVEGTERKKLVARFKDLVKKLEDSNNPVDTETGNLIKKYRRFSFLLNN